MKQVFIFIIKDVFFIKKGLTVFVGDMTPNTKLPADTLVKKCMCKLLVDGKEITQIIIEGETLEGEATGRSLWTRQEINLSREQIVGRNSLLIASS